MRNGPRRLEDATLGDVVGGAPPPKTLGDGPDKDLADVIDGRQVVQGTANGDVIEGQAGDQHVFGLDGNDHIQAGAGNDLIEAGAGDDVVFWRPGDGADRLQGGDGTDTLAMVVDRETFEHILTLGGLEALARAIVVAPGSPAPVVGSGFLDLRGVTGQVNFGNGQGFMFSGFERLLLTIG